MFELFVEWVLFYSEDLEGEVGIVIVAGNRNMSKDGGSTDERFLVLIVVGREKVWEYEKDFQPVS